MVNKYNFMWTSPNGGGVPQVTIADYGISFNMGAIKQMNEPLKIRIGYDTKQKVVGIQAIYDESSATTDAFDFMSKLRQNSIRIGNKDFIKYIGMTSGIDFSSAKKYIGNWIDEDSLLIIDLNSASESDKKDTLDNEDN